MKTGARAICWMGIVMGVTVTLGACEARKQNGGSQKGTITQEELVRREQELMDSVAGGDKAPWNKYFAEDSMYFDEKGQNMDKAAMVKTIEGLPPGYSGAIKIQKAQSRIMEDVAIISYDMDETETVFGQDLRARYHATDTWVRRNGEWQLLAGQMLRFYEDPAAGKAEPERYKEYVGTYEVASGKTMSVSFEGGKLFSRRGNGSRLELIPEAGDILFNKGVEGRIVFRRGAEGIVDALIQRRNNEDVVWKKIG